MLGFSEIVPAVSGRRPRITAILACFNRRALTVSCLERVFEQDCEANFEVVLVDDGSSDGTADAVLALFPETTIVTGDGNLFWAAGMALADRTAWRRHPDYLLWLNDDTMIDSGAVRRLLEIENAQPGSIVVGAVRDPHTGVRTYGGMRQPGSHPLRLERLPVVSEPTPIDAMNGNIVLVPASARAIVGPIDGLFGHYYADIDYAMRANDAGVPVLLAPGTVGICEDNPGFPTPSTPSAAIKQLFGRKGLPPASQYRFLKRHAPVAWPAYFAWSYVKGVPLAVARSARAKADDG